MNSKICVVIAEKSVEDLLSKLAQLEAEHDFFEIRFDYLENLSAETIEKVLQHKKSTVIATIRTSQEGGFFEGAEDEYAQLISACYENGADFVDVELAQLESNKNLKLTDENRTIISYHNFDSTPDDSELKSILERMKNISNKAKNKIAAQVNEMNDVVRLTSLLRAQTKDSAVVIAMGEMGQMLRLLAPSLGAFATFASSETTPVAPGQLYYKTMNKLLDAMETQDGRQ